MGLVGSYGTTFAKINIHYFGYIAHLYLLALLYPLYRLYQESTLSLRRFELILASLLFFACLLVLQALFAEPLFRGKIGIIVLEALRPLIGLFGVWILILTALFLSLVILFDKSTDEIYHAIASRIASFWSALGALLSVKKKVTPKENQAQEAKGQNPPKSAPLNESNPPLSDLERYLGLPQNSPSKPKNEERGDDYATLSSEESLPSEDNYAKLVRLVKNPSKEQGESLKPSSSAKIVEASTHMRPSRISTPTPSTPAPLAPPLEPKLKPESPLEESPSLAKAEEPWVAPTPIALETKGVDSPVIIKELEENIALLRSLEFGDSQKPKDFKLPRFEFLQKPKEQRIEVDEAEIDRKIQDLLGKLRMFKIEGDIARTYSGPIVTTFEFRPSPNVKVSRILTLEDDLAMALKAKTIRIQAPVPGKDVVGIEIPNSTVETIYLREVLESELFQKSASPLTLALGKDIVGKPFITDLKKLPHLLIAGTTGSGKSVGINAMILSLLYKNSPDNLKLIMIDPKMLEFSIYNDIPHLLTPVITQPKKAIAALSNTVAEMERRYEAMSKAKTKNIENYNEKAQKEGFAPFPYIVVIIDELADLMMTGGKEVEYSIARLAQMARASGIHLIVATQRPSVDIVTGLIKANLPSRISYKVGQKIDSKVILDSFGAESLLGRGDMLFTPPGSSGLVRLHAPWSTEEEIEEIVEYLKSQRTAEYDESFLSEEEDSSSFSKSSMGMDEGGGDDLYEEAKRVILSDKKTSISYIQRRLGIGYNKAATLIEQMEKRGFLSPPNSKGNREILGS
ncbi:FtsK/SpoIIIE family DNA translocase [Wolinella succinogenes]|uniref:SEPTUM FORMATION PROTEIN n=1 Tax=Wolinella succinogenes (strain ATCC 29543 / DSM 1740 / CCUG 13145 / JCM 31913 / LMG 7466 / NCTC 11488 / FDC 602W) TaxID=273121 RepID=Q7MAQ4_WOLSU|nr:DNA translocase FtsK [Wolinella succinogenes]CAE09264.1 SEPTUM FORMATION PROTEIN [Wolinella succinogenes]HCZ19626.1 DNA translocase FtsK [Helicobacter sp.]